MGEVSGTVTFPSLGIVLGPENLKEQPMSDDPYAAMLARAQAARERAEAAQKEHSVFSNWYWATDHLVPWRVESAVGALKITTEAIPALAADVEALVAAHADMLRRIEADGYSYCTEHGIQKWRGSLQLPKGYRGCGPCYWEQWYERKMDALAVQPHASVARKEGG